MIDYIFFLSICALIFEIIVALEIIRLNNIRIKNSAHRIYKISFLDGDDKIEHLIGKPNQYFSKINLTAKISMWISYILILGILVDEAFSLDFLGYYL